MPLRGQGLQRQATPAPILPNTQLASAMRSWNKRAASAQAAGISLKPLAHVARLDFQRIQQGRAPLSNIEAATATRARMHGKADVFTTEQDHGFLGLGNIVDDITSIGQALLPTTLFPALATEVYTAVTHPEETISGLGHLVAGIAQLGPLTRAGTKELGKAERTPGVRFIPGLMTAYRLGHDPSQVSQHPLQTILDLLLAAGGATRVLTRATVGEGAIAEILAREAAGKIGLARTGRIAEEAALTGRERIIAAAAHGRPIRAGLRAVAPDVTAGIERGSLAFRQRMGFGPSARYLSRQESILQRQAKHVSHAFEKERLRPLYQNLTPEDRQLAFDVATRPDIHPPGSYPPHIAETVAGTRTLMNEFALKSQIFGDKALIPVMYKGQLHWYSSEGAEGAVGRSYLRHQKADTLLEETRKQLDEAKTVAHGELLPAQEAKIVALQERVAVETEGKPSVPAPARARKGIEYLSSTAPRFQAAVKSWLNVARGSLLGKSLIDIQEKVWLYEQIAKWYEKEGVTTPLRGQVTMLKGLLDKEERTSLIAHLEENGISHVVLRNGREADVWSRFGIAKPGRVYGRAAKPSTAERVLAQLQDEKAKLDSGEFAATHPEVRKLQSAYNRRLKAAQSANEEFFKRFQKTAPAAYKPMLESQVLERTVAEAQKLRAVGELGRPGGPLPLTMGEAIDQYIVSLEPEYLLPGPEGLKLYQQIRRDIESTWLDLVEKGYEPVWMHNVTEATLRRELQIKPYGTNIRSPKQLKLRTIDPSNSIADIMVATTTAARQYTERLWHMKYIEDHVLPYTRTAEEVNAEILQQTAIEAKKGIAGGSSRGNVFERLRGEKYERFDPQSLFGITSPRLVQYAEQKGVLYIPKDIANVVKQLMEPVRGVGGPIGRGLTRTTSIFKMSVLGFSIKHMSDVFFADMMWLMLRGGKEELSLPRWMEAFKTVRRNEMPIELPSHLDQLSPDAVFQIALGKRLGHFWQEHSTFKKYTTMLYKVEETVNNTQRMVAYLSEQARGVKAGLPDQAAHDAALAHAYRTVLDVDSLVPFERVILRQVFPFYSFMRYIMTYAFTFPFDHPVRAAIINKIAEIERKDWDSGLPQQFRNYFFIGHEDAQGNQEALDVRSLNPFRDLSNFFTFSGFVSQLNPLAGGVLRVMGVNPLSATPELYPTMKYDPYLGRLVNANPSFGEGVLDIAKSVVPQVELLDYFGLMTQDMRELKASNPEAYRRVLYRNLFLPFTPRTINVGDEKQKAALAKLDEASRAVSDAMRTGKPLPSRYKLVPYQGKLVSAAQINALIATLSNRGVSPKAIAPR